MADIKKYGEEPNQIVMETERGLQWTKQPPTIEERLAQLEARIEELEKGLRHE